MRPEEHRSHSLVVAYGTWLESDRSSVSEEIAMVEASEPPKRERVTFLEEVVEGAETEMPWEGTWKDWRYEAGRPPPPPGSPKMPKVEKAVVVQLTLFEEGETLQEESWLQEDPVQRYILRLPSARPAMSEAAYDRETVRAWSKEVSWLEGSVRAERL
jgi:hypothetical protein